MKKIKNIVIGGIQQKVFNLVLIVILLMMAAYTVVIIHQAGRIGSLVTETNEKQRQSISESSRQTMDAVISQSMGSSTRMEAYIANDLFEDLADTVKMLGDYAGNIFRAPESYATLSYALPDPAKEGEITIQLLTEAGLNVNDPALAEKLGLVANMSDMMKALYANGNVNSCYIALPEGAMLLADDHSAGKFNEDGSLMPIPIRERDWYRGAKETGRLFYTDVVQDVFTGQIGIMCALPVYQGNRLAAVVGADLFLDNMSEAVAGTGKNGAFTFIVNQYGHVVFSPLTEGSLRVHPPMEAEDLRQSDEETLSAFVSSALKGFTDVTAVNVDGEAYYMTGAPVESVGWTVISAVSQATTRQPTDMLEQQYDSILSEAMAAFNGGLGHARTTILILLAVILVLGITGALVLSKRIVKPLGIMTERVQSLGGNNLQFFMEDAYRTGDEIEVLADAFATLSARTLQYVDQVQRVTAEKERIGAELSMATDIQASQLPRLFPAFPNRPEFDVYASMTPAKEVGGDFYDFFLVDDDHIGLVMADVSGKGVPAALFMMISRVLIKSHLQNGETPGEALENVNDQLCEGNDAELFVTVWLAVLEISTGKGIAVNAGHEHPALRRANGQYELVVYRHSPAVATLEGIPYKEHTFQLNPGDSLFVYTDGVAEATSADKDLFGTERMLEALNRDPDAEPMGVLKNVMDGINAFVADAEQFDDITMLCLKYIGKQ
ncbi:MAG: SpoIIE family protein phosphatase [Clostridia bacterium]|nr:SpoIIE family protein phosphatase [Clostridia bacterium]